VTRGGERSAWARASLGEALVDEQGARDACPKRVAEPLNQWRARSAVDPRRPIPNRDVKHRSAEGTGGKPAGRVGPRAITKCKMKKEECKTAAGGFAFCILHSRRGVEQWQLVGLITRRSVVRIHPPLPAQYQDLKSQDFRSWYFLLAHLARFLLQTEHDCVHGPARCFHLPMLQLIPVIPSWSQRLDAQTLTTTNRRRHTRAWRPTGSAAQL
jgi:hypothetical protein